MELLYMETVPSMYASCFKNTPNIYTKNLIL